MFEFFRSLVPIVAPIFVVSTMLYPKVLVMITLANTLGIVMLLLIAKALSRDNKVETEPV